MIIDKQTIESETRMYMFDLLNTAKEHGFKTDDAWELSMATNAERIKLQKDYYPAIAAKIFPEILLQVFHTIKARLNQSSSSKEESARNVLTEELNYLVAINPKRPRA